MRPLFTLAAILILGACENPVEHFTDPPKDTCKVIIVPPDTVRGPLPPGYGLDTLDCSEHRP